MKKRINKKIILIILLCMSYNGYSQSKYDDLITKTEMVKQSGMMVDQMIDYYAKQKPEVPDDVWVKVKNSITYKSFIADIKSVFKKYYTTKEVDDLIATIDTYGIRAYQPKPEVTQAMYNLGKEFGVKIGNQIKTKLQELGY